MARGNPETGYLVCDSSPTKSEVLKSGKFLNKEFIGNYHWQRHQEEFYNLKTDLDCITNLVKNPNYETEKKK
jgi:hypothetical protein